MEPVKDESGIEGARCSGSTSVSKTERSGSIPDGPANRPGYCITCGTIEWSDLLECRSGRCWWISTLPEEPQRAA